MMATASTREPIDFASAVMMRLVAAGLQKQDIAMPIGRPETATVPLAAKRAVLGRVLEAHGARAILAIADAVPAMTGEPLLTALGRAASLRDLMDRWQRLERFSHSCHQIVARWHGEHSVVLAHRVRLGAGDPPAAETLLVLGLIARLAQWVMDAPVRLETPAGEVWCDGTEWRVGSIDDGAIGPVAMTIGPVNADAAREPQPVPARGCDRIERLRQRLQADLLRRWTVGDLAHTAALSSRSLQRFLRAENLTFSGLVAETRLQHAAALLCQPRGPGLAEIGFLCGYSDQPHFVRSFRRGVGTTPAAFRRDFAGKLDAEQVQIPSAAR